MHSPILERTKMKRFFSLCMALVLVFCLVGCGSNSHKGEAKTPSDANAQEGRDYHDVKKDFKKAGFKNIKLKKHKDLVTGWVTKDGEVESVSVDGDDNYSSDTWYPSDTKIIITYHTFPDEKSESADKSESSNTSTSENKSKDEVLTIQNCPDLAAMLQIKADSDPSFSKFAKTYKGKTIEFDGCIIYMARHENYKTRFDFLLSAGNYVDENTANPGPVFKFDDVGAYELGYSGYYTPPVDVGDNIKIKATVESYDENSQLFMLEPISIKER